MRRTNLHFIKINIKNAANVVLHTAITTKVLVLFRSCCLIGKNIKRVEVSCLYLTKNYSCFELLLLQSLFKKRRVA